MQQYIGTKIVQAEPEVSECGASEGYKVVYEDGYTSWSPASAFEKAYIPFNAEGLQPHEQRVVAEKAQLDDRLAKLENFLNGDIVIKLPGNEIELLTKQRMIMQNLSDVLAQRIQNFQIK